MNACIISIGNELTSGQAINTNSTYISNFLKKYGIPVRMVITVGDERESIFEAMNICQNDGDLIFITGGLGPTHDDITKAVVSEYFESKMVFHEEILNQIRNIFDRRGIVMSDSNLTQAMIPDKAEIIPNPIGTAVGMKFKKEGKLFYIIPGVPSEMERILTDFIYRDLETLSNTKIKSKVIHTTGMSESELYEKLKKWINDQNQIEISILPHFTHVDIVLNTSASNGSDILNLSKSEIQSLLCDIIYGYDEETLESVIANLLIDRKLSISVAESCTGGLIADRLTNVSGSSAYFKMGVVTYSNESKINLLKVNPAIIKDFGAVSPETAKEMAISIRKLSNCDIGLSSTGIAGPLGGTEKKPVGLVYIGISMDGLLEIHEFRFLRDRITNKNLFSQMALNQLRLALIRG